MYHVPALTQQLPQSPASTALTGEEGPGPSTAATGEESSTYSVRTDNPFGHF